MSRQETATTDTPPESDGEPIRVVLVGGFLGVGDDGSGPDVPGPAPLD